MAKSPAFDTYDPAKIDALREGAMFATKPSSRHEPIVHECCECGAPAHFGIGVSVLKGLRGDWYCREHKPDEAPRQERAP